MPADMTQVKEALAEWVNRGCDEALAILRDDINAPIGTADDPHQGFLRDSEQVLPISTVDAGGGEWRASLAYTADYASYTDTGSDPHPIPAPLAFNSEKIGKFVIISPNRPSGAFVTKDGALVVFKDHVDHPGSPGTMWFSGKVNPDHWAEILQEAFDSIGPA